MISFRFYSNFKATFPFAVEETPSYTHKTYLDTTGRPVYRVTKRNVVAEHNQPFQLTYTFSRNNMLHEPMLLIASWFVLFALVMAYQRLDISISSGVCSLFKCLVFHIVIFYVILV